MDAAPEPMEIGLVEENKDNLILGTVLGIFMGILVLLALVASFH